MARYRAVIIGAGRIGAGWNWPDPAYTHAGAYKALSDRVELCAFVEPNQERRDAAVKAWGSTGYQHIHAAMLDVKPDIVSVCVQPEDQFWVLQQIPRIKGIWCEKPWMGPNAEGAIPIQVNYLRRADVVHQGMAMRETSDQKIIFIIGKDDLHTRCHFEDLAKWWNATLYYLPFNGPCSYIYRTGLVEHHFGFGGIDAGECMKGMLGNLLDHIEGKAELWSPPYPRT